MPEPTEPAGWLGRSRVYWLFGGLFVFLAAGLWLSQRMEGTGSAPAAKPNASEAAPLAAVKAFSDVIEKRAYDPKKITDRKGFADGMQGLTLRLEAQKFRTLPPAAAPSGTDAMANLGPAVTLSRLSVATPDGLPIPPEGRSLRLEIGATETREGVSLTGFPTPVDLVVEEGAMLTLAIFIIEPSRGWFSAEKSERWTKIARIAISDIRRRGPVQLKLVGERPLREGAPIESVTLELGVRTTRFEPSAATVKSTPLRAGPADGVAVHQTKPGASEGWVERVIVPAAGSMTYALIWRDRRGPGATEVRLTDGGPPIGIVAPGLPLLAAAADGWASLAITLANNPRRDSVSFLVTAASGDNGAAEALFFEFANRLQELTVDGAPLSGSECARVLAWTRMVFGLPPEVDPTLLDRLPPDLAAALRRALAKGAAR